MESRNDLSDRSADEALELAIAAEEEAFMTMQRAADIAIGAERRAFRFYDLIERVDDGQLASLLGELRGQGALTSRPRRPSSPARG